MRLATAGLCLLAATVFCAPAMAEGPLPEVAPLQLEKVDDGIYLTTTVRFDLPPVVDDALQKGIPMFFLLESEVVRERWYWVDKRVVYATRTLRLAFQPLTRRWRLSVGTGGGVSTGLGLALNQNFESLSEALATLQRVSRWKIADSSELDADASYSVDFRMRLDLTQLPRPFQIGAVGQSEWVIATGRRQRITPELLR